MNLNFGMRSIVSFAASVLFLVLLTLFEPSLINVSLRTERMISFLLLVLPGVIGIVFGVLGIVRKESKRWIAYMGILLNSLFALFHLFVLSFAG